MNKKFVLFIFLLAVLNPFNASSTAWDTCPMDGTKIDVSELININRPAGIASYVCNAPVATFDMEIKQMALCTADPTNYINGISSVDPCFYLLNHRTGDSVINVGITPAASASFPTTFPPTGTYSHSYALLNNTFSITAEYETNATVLAANEAGNGWIASSFVGPGNRSVSMRNMALGSWQLFTEGFQSSQSSKNTMLFSYDSLSTSNFLNTLTSTNSRGNLEILTLVDSSGNLAADYSDVSDMLFIETFPSPIEITDKTTELRYMYSQRLAGRFIWTNAGSSWVSLGFHLGSIGFKTEFN